MSQQQQSQLHNNINNSSGKQRVSATFACLSNCICSCWFSMSSGAVLWWSNSFSFTLYLSLSLTHTHWHSFSKKKSKKNNGKGKFLTRSHAMHECTSPPQTPTPRAGNSSQSTVALINDSTKADTNTKMSSLSPITVNATNAMQTNAQQSSTTPNLFAPNGNLNVSQLDLEFPKLTPPKSKSPR